MAFSKKVREQHFRENIQWWNSYGHLSMDANTGFIEKQTALTGISFGVHNSMLSRLFLAGRRLCAVENSCEVIGAYNALVALGQEASFPKLLERFEKKGIFLWGYFGTTPWSVKYYFKKQGYRIAVLRLGSINHGNMEKMVQSLPQKKTFILTTMNNRDNIWDMIHTVNISVEKNGYTIHNDYEGTKTYATLQEAVFGYHKGKGSPLYLLGIGSNI